MPNYTSRFNLSKPLTTENYDIAKVTNENADKLDTSATQLLTTTETITVGTGGQYATINQALEYATKKYPTYVSASTRPRITISLLSGFVMAEQVLVDGIDLSWITISSVDAEVSITRSALTTNMSSFTGSTAYPAFIAIQGGFLPIINTLFNMDTSGSATGRWGVGVVQNSKAIINSGKGVKNSGGRGLVALKNSTIEAYDCDFSGSGLYGISAESGSTINANGANASYAINNGVYAVNASTIEFSGGNAQRAGYNTSDVLVNANADGIYASSSSTINANSANASYSARYGVYARYNSRINFNGGIATNIGNHSVYAYSNSTIYAGSSNCSTDGSPAEEYRCLSNSFIDIYNATGEVNTSPTLNTYTNDGLITNGAGNITTNGSLPLTGGTLTGALTGTNANFNSMNLKNSSVLDKQIVFYVDNPNDKYVIQAVQQNVGYKTLSLNPDGGYVGANGIKFPATQNPSADANTLDDYEEGTFTPTLVGSTTAGSPTYTSRNGFYTKIGNVVNIAGRIDISSKGGLVGVVSIQNLPFTSNASISSSAVSIGEMGYLTFGSFLPTLQITPNSTRIVFTYAGSGSSPSNFNDTNISDSFALRFSATYQV